MYKGAKIKIHTCQKLYKPENNGMISVPEEKKKVSLEFYIQQKHLSEMSEIKTFSNNLRECVVNSPTIRRDVNKSSLVDGKLHYLDLSTGIKHAGNGKYMDKV